MDAAARRGGQSQGPAAVPPRFLAWLAARARQPQVPPQHQPPAGRPWPAVPSPYGVFISYRRTDTGPYSRLLKAALSQRLPQAQVFMDLDSIDPGLDFEEVIRGALTSCLVMVTLIGPKWATTADEEGRRRIDDPGDYVRFEIRTALERGVRVIPVLADGATPLRRQQLPADLRDLARLNTLEMSYDRYEYDETRLANAIAKVLAAQEPSPGNARPAVKATCHHPPRCRGGHRPARLPAPADLPPGVAVHNRCTGARAWPGPGAGHLRYHGADLPGSVAP